MTIAPLAFGLSDGSIPTLGFIGQQLRKEYKVRPDYLTGTLFFAERIEAP